MSAVGRLPKPQMRHLLRDYIRKTFLVSFMGGAVCAGIYWFKVNLRAERIEARIKRDYNPERDYERMKNLGLFQHVRPDDESKAYYPTW